MSDDQERSGQIDYSKVMPAPEPPPEAPEPRRDEYGRSLDAKGEASMDFQNAVPPPEQAAIQLFRTDGSAIRHGNFPGLDLTQLLRSSGDWRKADLRGLEVGVEGGRFVELKGNYESADVRGTTFVRVDFSAWPSSAWRFVQWGDARIKECKLSKALADAIVEGGGRLERCQIAEKGAE